MSAPNDACVFTDGNGNAYPGRYIDVKGGGATATLIAFTDPPTVWGPSIAGFFSMDETPVPIEGTGNDYTAWVTPEVDTLQTSATANASAAADATTAAGGSNVPWELGPMGGDVANFTFNDRTIGGDAFTDIRHNAGHPGGGNRVTYLDFQSAVQLNQLQIACRDGAPASGDFLRFTLTRKKTGSKVWEAFDTSGGTSEFQTDSGQLGQSADQTTSILFPDVQSDNWPCIIRLTVTTHGRLTGGERFGVVGVHGVV